MVYPGLQKSLYKEESLELRSQYRVEIRETSHTGRQQIPDRCQRAMKLNECSPDHFNLHISELSKASCLRIWGCGPLIHKIGRAKLNGKTKRGVYCQSDGSWHRKVAMSYSYCRSGIWQAASAVCLTGVLRDLDYLCPERAMNHSSESPCASSAPTPNNSTGTQQ